MPKRSEKRLVLREPIPFLENHGVEKSEITETESEIQIELVVVRKLPPVVRRGTLLSALDPVTWRAKSHDGNA